MAVDVSFHPLDESLISKYYNRGIEDGPGIVDLDGPSKVVQKKRMIDLVSDVFKKDTEQLSGRPNFNQDIMTYCRPYFLTVTSPDEIVGVLKILEQAQSPGEIFDVFHRQAEHVDFAFAEAKVALKPSVLQQVSTMQSIGAIQMSMYDWLDKKAYRYAMTRFMGFFAKGKIKKFRPKRMTAQEEVHFKNELKRKPEEISADIGRSIGFDVATLMSTMYPTWRTRGVGLTDLNAWAEHLLPMIEGPQYLFTRLPTYNFIETHITKRVKAGMSGGCIRSQNIGQFIDSLKTGKNDIVKIFDRVGHYTDVAVQLVDRLIEAGQYALQRGFGLLEASGVVPPY